MDSNETLILSEGSIAVHVLFIYMLTSLSVDEILPPGYVKWSTNFSDLPVNVGITLSFNKEIVKNALFGQKKDFLSHLHPLYNVTKFLKVNI